MRQPGSETRAPVHPIHDLLLTSRFPPPLELQTIDVCIPILFGHIGQAAQPVDERPGSSYRCSQRRLLGIWQQPGQTSAVEVHHAGID